MNRKPVYHKDAKGVVDHKNRIVSVPNGLWQLQASYGKGTRETSGWRNVARPTDRDTALGQMAGRAR